ncbi:carboxypeptidase regulatory-like domain-containing protein [Neobacillus soli]|uniref:carboxypeptidase regulatory-like domain-containing protein n=1 Tax=Neobacillus soli TaxID=220688 RepID=UPI000826B365|nr:carboxypeptidase regulatory-like domain-containing protein [Neobacillus soli]
MERLFLQLLGIFRRGGMSSKQLKKGSFKVLISLLVLQLFIGNFDFSKAAAASQPKISRTSASSSVNLAITVSKKQFPKTSKKAVLTNKEDNNNIYISSLYSNKLKAPLLLTEKKGLNSSVKKELQRLKVKEITIIANKKQIDTNVEKDLKKLKIKVKKINGKDVTDTSIQVAKQMKPSKGIIYLVSSKKMDYSASVPAIAMSKNAAIIVVDPKKLNGTAIKYINQYQQKVQIHSLGVSKTVLKQMKNVVTITGKDVYNLSSNLVKMNGQTGKNLYLVAKNNYPYAALISSLAVKEKASVVIAPNSLTTDVKSLILAKKVNDVKVFADKKYLSDKTVRDYYSAITYQKKLPAKAGVAEMNDKVKVLSKTQTNSLLSSIKTQQEVTNGTVKLRVSTIDPKVMIKDSIIALDPTKDNPMGGFLKVNEVKKAGSQYDVTVSQPTLDEVFQDLKLSVDEEVDASKIVAANLEPGVTIDNSAPGNSTSFQKQGQTKAKDLTLKVNMDLLKYTKDYEILKGKGKANANLSASGKISIKDIKLTTDVEKVASIPVKMQFNVKYKTETNLNFTAKGKMDWKFKDQGLGEFKGSLGEIEGVNVTDGRLPLGSVTFIVTPTAIVPKSGVGASGYVQCPVGVTIFLVMTASGNIEAEITYDYVKKTEFDQGVSLSIKNPKPKFSKGPKDGITAQTETLSAKGKLHGEVGFGIDAALNIGGIMPLVLRADGKGVLDVSGSLTLKNDLLKKDMQLEGCYDMKFAPVTQIKVLARLKWESWLLPNGNINKELVISDKKWFETKKSACYLSNGVEGYVTDAAANLPIENAVIEAVDKDQPGAKYKAKSDKEGKYTLLLPVGTYNISYAVSGYKTVVLNDVKIENKQITYNPKLEIIKSDLYNKTGTVGGVITDAQTGRAVSNASITIYQGLNVSSGQKIKTLTTDGDGNYLLVLPTGHYTAVIEKAGYIKNTITLVSLPNIEKLNYNGTITANLSPDEIRIVLTWGQVPSDLDSHLAAPYEDKNGSYEIYYGRKTHYYNGELMTKLDVDDTDSEGPETVTILKQVPGTYTYSVVDYTNLDRDDSNELSNSSAKVQVYMGSGSSPVKTFYVPSNKIGNKWNVFKLDGKTITPINTIVNDSDEDNVDYD